MKLLFIGDIVGEPGRKAVESIVPRLRDEHALDFVIANGENSAGGNGITPPIAGELFSAGVDVITSGDHLWDQKTVSELLYSEPRFLRPLNYPPGVIGRGANVFQVRNLPPIGVMNVQGRVFMPPMENPFTTADEAVSRLREQTKIIFVDFHGEASSEKQGIGFFCDGRASLVVGTHTHVPTADHQILPGGTAYMTDAGMTGDYDSVIGMQKDEPLRRFTTGIPSGRFEPALGAATLSGVAVETDDSTGLALRVAPVRMGGRLQPALPEFWVPGGNTLA